MSTDPRRRVVEVSDIRGMGQLVVDAVTGITDIVEELHGSIAGASPMIGDASVGGAGRIPELVYRGVRGVTRSIGVGQNSALEKLTPLLSRDGESSPHRESAVGVLNGVVGDFLDETGNPMAISMHLRWDGRPWVPGGQVLVAPEAPAGSRLLVLVHGLCMTAQAWNRGGHDHGVTLARDLGYTPIYVAYNSGRHISVNGRELATALERLVKAWPIPVTELVLVGHSMGGLVSRSACHYAMEAGHRWLQFLKTCVFLGTPHQGAPLERAGNWAEMLLGISPYTAPLIRAGKIRSAGIQDLRYGSILDEHRGRRGGAHTHDPRDQVPLPVGVSCWAIAATLQPHSGDADAEVPGDGLVPVQSALGQHADPAFSLPIPLSQRSVFHGLNHLELLGSQAVCDRIRYGLESGRMS